jgi:hypothetical protein
MSLRYARMSQSGPRVEARSLSSERIPRENMSGPSGSPCLTPCAEVMVCLPWGELSTRLELQPYAIHQPGRGQARTGGAPGLCLACRRC